MDIAPPTRDAAGMGPLAKKLLVELTRRGATGLATELERTVRVARRHTPDLGDAPEPCARWMKHFMFVAKLGMSLCHSNRLREHTERIDLVHEEFMPGGPPMSPVLDSAFMSWATLDATIGEGRETLATLVADLGARLGLNKNEIAAARQLAATYAGVFRVESRPSPHRVVLVELVTGERRDTWVIEPFAGEPGQLWWVRLVPDDDSWVCFATPYVFRARDAAAQWAEYFGRVAPESTSYRRLMKEGSSPTAWFDFMVDGYAGADDRVVFLTGVPDRPATLPHSPEREATMTLAARAVETARALAARTGRVGEAIRQFSSAREAVGLPSAPPEAWQEWELRMSSAHSLYGVEDELGRSAAHAALAEEGLDEALRAEIAAHAEGWFSLFEVRRVRIDEGVELFDRLRRRKLWVTEKLATRAIDLGQVLAGWVYPDGDLVRFEGVILPLPPLWAEDLTAQIKAIYGKLPARFGWRGRLAMLPPYVSALVTKAAATPRLPTMLTKDGARLTIARARYRVHDAVRARAVLDALPMLERSEDEYYWLDDAGSILGRIEIEPAQLSVECMSRPNLERARRMLERALDGAIRHEVDSFEEPSISAAGLSGAASAPPPEVELAVVAQLMTEHLARWIDEPIPMLGDKTPRQAVRSARGREDVASMLMTQERALRSTLGDAVDFRSIWEALGLSYPGPPSQD